MNVDVVSCWYLECQSCQALAGISLQQPVLQRSNAACPCKKGDFRWVPRTSVYLGDTWDRMSTSRNAAIQRARR